MSCRFRAWLLLLFTLLCPSVLVGQLQELGGIAGQVRLARGEVPSRSIMVELRLHGGTVNAVYTDAQGRFGFWGLEANTYYIVIEDAAYYPVSERVDLRPEAPNATLQVVLQPRENTKTGDARDSRVAGTNPYLTDAAEYNNRFPKKAVNEYKRGLQAESKGKSDEAIAHYQAALKIAPEYYPAINNLGALYLSGKDFKSAETQFQEAIHLEPKEAQAYFNLGNLLLLTGRYSESEAMLAAGLQRRPDSAFAHFLQGSLLERTGRFVEAERNLREALRLDPSMPQPRLVLVNVYLRQNRKEDAVHQLQDFLKAFPEAPMAAKAKEVLNRLQAEEASRSQ